MLHNPQFQGSGFPRFLNYAARTPQHIDKMVRYKTLATLCLAYGLCGMVSAQNEPRHISNELFDSLEELARLVDIAYCVGTSGVQQPFQCLSHCAEFPNLELVTVSASSRSSDTREMLIFS